MRAQEVLVVVATLLGAGAAHASLAISSAATTNVQCSAGTCTATSDKAVLNATDLANMLAASDVTVQAANGAISIAVTASFSWTSAHRLTLDASDGIDVREPIVVAGAGAMTITPNHGGSGDLSFPGEGHIEFWDTSSSLIVAGHGYTLSNSVAGLAQAIAGDPSGFHALAKGYDAAPDGAYENAPIPSFAGTFEGLGNAVSNLTISKPKGKKGQLLNAGLFSASSGTIRDIDLLNANVSVGHKDPIYVGALVAINSGTILQAYVTSTMDITIYHADMALGGMVGVNKGTILRSHSDSIIVNDSGGGLVGVNAPGGVISHCYSSGSVNSDPKFATIGGGLVSENQPGAAITLSHSDAAVSGGFSAGGLAGFNNGNVTLSFAEGHVTGTGELGGLIGGDSQYAGGSVANVYATATVDGTADASVGGLMGGSGEKTVVSQAYASGALSARQAGDLGGALGWDYPTDPATFSDVYWDLTTTGVNDKSRGAGNVANMPGVAGLTDKQLKKKLPAGFDPAIWGRKKTLNNGLPYLLANPPAQ